MRDIITYVLLGVALLLVIIMLQVNSRKFIQDLAVLLYEKRDPQTYLKKINSWQGKLFLSSKKRLFNSIDAYVLENDINKAIAIFETLESKHLSYGSKIGLYQKEVQFYVQNKMFDKAEQANQTLQQLGSQINDKNMTKILDEATELIEIYVHKNPDFAKVMLQKYDEASNEVLKGIYAYRAAKCFYYKNDKKNTEKYLKECRNKCKGTFWARHADACLQDITKIEER